MIMGNYSLRSKERPYLAHLERKRFRKMLIPAFAGTGASPCMLRFFETVFVQPALKSDRSPSVNSILRAVTIMVRFFGTIFLLAYVLLNAAHASENQQSYYRNFWNPKFHGRPLDYCLPAQKECGAAVADQYCRLMGYDKSSKATIAYHVGLTNYVSGCSECKGWACNGFARISCVATTRHEPTRDYYFRSKKFVFPRFKHYRVAWCYKNGQGCGKRAAFSFCRRMGYMREQQYEKESHIAATRALGNQRLCFGDTCNAFSSITCYR